MGILKWIIAKIFCNIGKVKGFPVYRSAQGIMLYLIFPFFRFDVVLNLSNKPDTDWHDRFEKWLCGKLGIEYIDKFRTIKPDDGSFAEAYKILLDRADAQLKKVLVHCEGGKDRTGSLIAVYMYDHLFELHEIVDHWTFHKIPHGGWLKFLFKRFSKCDEEKCSHPWCKEDMKFDGKG